MAQHPCGFKMDDGKICIIPVNDWDAQCLRKHPNLNRKPGPPLQVVQPEPELTKSEWRLAAEWVVQTDGMAAKTRKFDDLIYCSMDEIMKIVRKYLSDMNLGLEERDAVRHLVRQRIQKREGLTIGRGWCQFVVSLLPNIGDSPTLGPKVRALWRQEWQRVSSAMERAQNLQDIGVREVGGGGSGTITVSLTLLDQLGALRFSFAHETGHCVDGVLLDVNILDVQKALLKSDYTMEQQGHHREYFADGFATVLLLTANFGLETIIQDATQLFGSDVVSKEHPSGPLRIKNIRDVGKRHLGRAAV